MLSFASFGADCSFESGTLTASGTEELSRKNVTDAVNSNGGMAAITEVIIKNSVTTIGYSAFFLMIEL